MRSYMYEDNRTYCVPANSCFGKYTAINHPTGGLRHIEASAGGTCPSGWKVFRNGNVPDCDSARARFFMSTPALVLFTVSEVVLAAILVGSLFALGFAVTAWGWNPGYTRKLLGLVTLLAPPAVFSLLPYSENRITQLSGVVISICCLFLFVTPVRRRVRFLDIAFQAIDRSEDRPYTLRWLVTSNALASLVLMIMVWCVIPDQPALTYIAVAAVAVGDLVGGAVGLRYGMLKYRTSALFTNRTYYRSIEGSIAVFAVTLLAVFYFGSALPQPQFFAALYLMPLALTLAEAKAPHTWDEPVMMLTALVVGSFIVRIGIPA